MTSKAAIARAERTEALETLQGLLTEGDRLYTILRHVSQSGMQRRISVVHVTTSGEIDSLDWLISRAGLYARANTNNKEGLVVKGAGMDMGYAVVYGIACAVFGNGYALEQSWL